MKEMILVFITLFIAELGDKTQFAIISFASKSQKPLNVWISASVAFLLTNFLGIILGINITKIFPNQYYIKYISGIIFIIIGILTLLSKQ